MTSRVARGAEGEKRTESGWARAPRSRTSPTLRPRSAGGVQLAERVECGEPVDGRTRRAFSPGGSRAQRASRARGGGRGKGERGAGAGGEWEREGTPRTDVAVEVETCTVTHRLRVRLGVVLGRPSFFFFDEFFSRVQHGGTSGQHLRDREGQGQLSLLFQDWFVVCASRRPLVV